MSAAAAADSTWRHRLGSVDLSVSVDDGTDTAIPSTANWYTVTVMNRGDAAAHDVLINETLASDMQYSEHYRTTVTGRARDLYSEGFGDIYDVVFLPAGASITYTIYAFTLFAGNGKTTVTAKATLPPGVEDANPADNIASDIDVLDPKVNVGVTIDDNLRSTSPGSTVVYTIRVFNYGPSNTKGVLSDTMPSAFDSFTVSGPNGFYAQGVGGDTFSDPNVFTTEFLLGIGIVRFERDYTVTAHISATANGSVSNTVSTTPLNGIADTNPSDNVATDTDSLGPPADLSVAIRNIAGDSGQSTGTAVAGRYATFQITVTNNGPTDVAGAYLQASPYLQIPNPSYLDSGLAFYFAAGTGGASGFYNGDRAFRVSTVVISSFINQVLILPAGATVTYTVTVLLQLPPQDIGSIRLQAFLTALPGLSLNDPDLSNNSAIGSADIIPAA